MTKLPDNINAVLYLEDYRLLREVSSDRCLIIQKYEYSMQRSRKDNGEVYDNAPLGNIMTVTVSVGSADQIKPFYSRSTEFDTSRFSILFSAIFDKNGMLDSYSSGIVAEGYIVGIDEDFESDSQDGEQSMLITVRFLVTRMRFINKELNLTF